MANLKELKGRISSVSSTRKITRAMKMVAASKLRRAREKAEQASPYAQRMERMLCNLASNASGDDVPQLLIGNGKTDHHLLVVISSDRGLCGGFNTHIMKAVKEKVSKLQALGKKVSIFCIGKKGYELLNLSHRSNIVDKVEGLSKKKNLEFSDAKEQADKVITMFNEGQFDVCTIFYNRFVSAISQKVTEQQLIPLEVEKDVSSSSAVYDYEPSQSAILADLLPLNIAVQFYHAMLENSASEHGARMTAMDNASRNAGDMIKRLTLLYNRTRQAVITKELIEIISGAEAI